MIQDFTVRQPGVLYHREDVGYVAGKAPYGCTHCHWFNGKDACPVIAAPISKYGCCDYWNDPKAPKSASKAQAEYVQQPGTDFSCTDCNAFSFGRCGVFVPDDNLVNPPDSCDKWKFKDWPR